MRDFAVKKKKGGVGSGSIGGWLHSGRWGACSECIGVNFPPLAGTGDGTVRNTPPPLPSAPFMSVFVCEGGWVSGEKKGVNRLCVVEFL